MRSALFCLFHSLITLALQGMNAILFFRAVSIAGFFLLVGGMLEPPMLRREWGGF